MRVYVMRRAGVVDGLGFYRPTGISLPWPRWASLHPRILERFADGAFGWSLVWGE